MAVVILWDGWCIGGGRGSVNPRSGIGYSEIVRAQRQVGASLSFEIRRFCTYGMHFCVKSIKNWQNKVIFG